jgi:hypothetical protein
MIFFNRSQALFIIDNSGRGRNMMSPVFVVVVYVGPSRRMTSRDAM